MRKYAAILFLGLFPMKLGMDSAQPTPLIPAQPSGKRGEPGLAEKAEWFPAMEEENGLTKADFDRMGLRKLTKDEYGWLIAWLIVRDTPLLKYQSTDDLLDAKKKSFHDYDTDFIAYAKAAGSGLESEIGSDLEENASHAEDYLEVLSSELFIYDHLRSEKDRAMTKPFLLAHISLYSRLLNNFAQETGNDISHTTNQSLAAEATRMREDLRAARDILDSIRLQ